MMHLIFRHYINNCNIKNWVHCGFTSIEVYLLINKWSTVFQLHLCYSSSDLNSIVPLSRPKMKGHSLKTTKPDFIE